MNTQAERLRIIALSAPLAPPLARTEGRPPSHPHPIPLPAGPPHSRRLFAQQHQRQPAGRPPSFLPPAPAPQRPREPHTRPCRPDRPRGSTPLPPLGTRPSLSAQPLQCRPHVSREGWGGGGGGERSPPVTFRSISSALTRAVCACATACSRDLTSSIRLSRACWPPLMAAFRWVWGWDHGKRATIPLQQGWARGSASTGVPGARPTVVVPARPRQAGSGTRCRRECERQAAGGAHAVRHSQFEQNAAFIVAAVSRRELRWRVASVDAEHFQARRAQLQQRLRGAHIEQRPLAQHLRVRKVRRALRAGRTEKGARKPEGSAGRRRTSSPRPGGPRPWRSAPSGAYPPRRRQSRPACSGCRWRGAGEEIDCRETRACAALRQHADACRVRIGLAHQVRE